MLEFFQYMTSSFWIFVGCVILVSIPLRFIYAIIARTLRHYSLMKHGYPPSHCDADGVLLKQKNKE